MKVSDLIELLQGMNHDDEVHFAYRANDYWRTMVAPPVKEVFTGYVRRSDYHGTDKLLDIDDDIDLTTDDRNVVVLS